MTMKNRWKICGDVSILYFKRRSGEIWEALIDTYDLYRLHGLGSTWSVSHGTKDCFYIHSNIKGIHMKLHRFLMGNPENMHIDHMNGLPQDNRRTNMRIVTHAQNMQNRTAHSNSTSGLRGVRYHKADDRWVAEVTVGGKYMYLGSFITQEAANERVIAVRKEYMPFSAREVS